MDVRIGRDPHEDAPMLVAYLRKIGGKITVEGKTFP
jgi:hypothetical protein